MTRDPVHDCYRESDILACGDGKFLDIEGRSGLVITEEQVPGVFVCLNPFALQRGRQVEHHHIRLVMGEDGREVVPDGQRAPKPREGP
jgi:hypothetical protein